MICDAGRFNVELALDDPAKIAASQNKRASTSTSLIDYVASLKFKTIGVGIDTRTAEQTKYLQSWEMGT